MRRLLGRVWPSHDDVMMDDIEDYTSAMDCSLGTRSVLHLLVLCSGPKITPSGPVVTQKGLK